MRFKIKSTNIKISFTFFAVILLVMCFDNNGILLVSLISALFHELIHIVFILLFGGGIEEFSLTLFGGKIQRKQNLKLSNFKEAIISLCAPATNIIVGALFLFSKIQLIGYVNLVIGIFNALPFYDFDGGRGLFYLLSDYLEHSKITRILNVTSVISVSLISSFTVTLFFNKKASVSILLLSVYMVFVLFKNLSTENVKNI